MEKIIINGGNKLSGTVNISGSKNAVLPILAAAMLGETPSVVYNVPEVADVKTMIVILNRMGVKIKKIDEHTLKLDPRGLIKFKAPYDLVRMMRASICVLGPLISRFGRAEVSFPGGCVIGPRPIDLHIKGLRSLGINIEVKHGYISAFAKKINGRDIYLGGRYGPSVLATANVMMAAVKSNGTTIIESAACEPELEDLAGFLQKMGADIEGAGSHVIKIKGVKKLNGAEHTVIPDRIEAGTYLIAGAITRGNITLKNVCAGHIRAVLDKLKEAGVKIQIKSNDIQLNKSGRLEPISITTLPYPGFPTDMQAQIMSLMTLVQGLSIITEKIFPDRFMHIPELLRMSANISLEGATAVIKGVKRLSGASVMASDLRASAALVLSGLAAEGKTEINRVYHLDRGYENITGKLRALGADIKRV